MADMDAIYAWVDMPPEGDEFVICAIIPQLGPVITPLQHRRRAVVDALMRPIAERHRQITGHRVRLVRFARAETVEELP